MATKARRLKNGDLLPDTFRFWPNARTGPWKVELHWAVVDDRAECIGVTVTSDYEPARGKGARLRPLRTTEWREINPSTFIEEDRQLAEILPPIQAETYRKPPGMSADTLAMLREVARVYRAAGRKPTKAVADHFTITDSAAAKRVARAREIGLLPKSRSGVAVTRRRRAR
jgi:hypothetical protein